MADLGPVPRRLDVVCEYEMWPATGNDSDGQFKKKERV